MSGQKIIHVRTARDSPDPDPGVRPGAARAAFLKIALSLGNCHGVARGGRMIDSKANPNPTVGIEFRN